MDEQDYLEELKAHKDDLGPLLRKDSYFWTLLNNLKEAQYKRVRKSPSEAESAHYHLCALDALEGELMTVVKKLEYEEHNKEV